MRGEVSDRRWWYSHWQACWTPSRTTTPSLVSSSATVTLLQPLCCGTRGSNLLLLLLPLLSFLFSSKKKILRGSRFPQSLSSVFLPPTLLLLFLSPLCRTSSQPPDLPLRSANLKSLRQKSCLQGVGWMCGTEEAEVGGGLRGGCLHSHWLSVALFTPLPLFTLSKALPVFNLFPPVLSQSVLLDVCFPLLPPPLAGNTHLKCSGGTDKARQERGKAKQGKAAQPVTLRGRQEETKKRDKEREEQQSSADR